MVDVLKERTRKNNVVKYVGIFDFLARHEPLNKFNQLFIVRTVRATICKAQLEHVLTFSANLHGYCTNNVVRHAVRHTDCEQKCWNKNSLVW